jgi:hypothetical protein
MTRAALIKIDKTKISEASSLHCNIKFSQKLKKTPPVALGW